jgi:hypothetical protein
MIVTWSKNPTIFNADWTLQDSDCADKICSSRAVDRLGLLIVSSCHQNTFARPTALPRDRILLVQLASRFLNSTISFLPQPSFILFSYYEN